MSLPTALRFPAPAFWGLHLLVIPTVFAGGVALGIFHASGHGAAGSEHGSPTGASANASHAAHTPAAPDDPHAGHAAADPHAGHAAAADPHAGHGSSAPLAPSATAIRDEMVALQSAYDVLNRAVVLGDATGVAEAFHQVHARKQVTEISLEAGIARPPRNADRLDAFVARDEAFHTLLGTTVDAAEKGDLPTLRRMSGELQGACIGCHEEFRGTP